MSITRNVQNGLRHKLEMLSFGISGKKIRVVPIPRVENELGYTSKEGFIHLSFDNKYIDDLDELKSIAFTKGVWAHEFAHKLITDFTAFYAVLDSIPNKMEREIFATIFNVVEDPAIEFLASRYFRGSPLKCLRYTISQTYLKSPDINTDATPFSQYLMAAIQYGDGGVLKGEFSSKEAEDIFYESLKFFDEAIECPNGAKRVALSHKLYEFTRPLWEEDLKTQEAMQKFIDKMKDTMRKAGKASANGEPGVYEEPNFDDEEDSTDSSGRSKQLARKKTKEKHSKDGGGSPTDNEEESNDDAESGSGEKPSDLKSNDSDDKNKSEESSDKDTDNIGSSGNSKENKLSEDGGNSDDSSENNDSDSGASNSKEDEDSADDKDGFGDSDDYDDDSEDNEPYSNTSKNNQKNESDDDSEDGDESDDGDSSDDFDFSNNFDEKSSFDEDINDSKSNGIVDNESDKDETSSNDSNSEKSSSGNSSGDMPSTSSDGSLGDKPENNDNDALNAGSVDDSDDNSVIEGTGEITYEEYELTEEDIADLKKERQELKELNENLKNKEKEIKEAFNENLDIDEMKQFYPGVSCKNVRINCIPTEEISSAYNRILNPMQGSINILCNQLKRIFKNSAEDIERKTSGKINIKRLSGGKLTTRVFDRRKNPNNISDICVMILMDESGSMSGKKSECTRNMAIGLAEVFDRLHVPLSIIGFTADHDGADAVHYHYLNWHNSLTERYRLLKVKSYCTNFDGYSIRYATERLKKRRETHKILIVISDGTPSSRYYRGRLKGISDTACAIREASKIADVIGVAVDNNAADLLFTMYKQHFLQVKKVDDLFSQLARKIKDKIKGW